MTHSLILGGVRSGKTALAEEAAQQYAKQTGQPVLYVATATPGDAEMAARIAAHQVSRPAHWGLVEEPVHLGRVVAEHASSAPCLLVDCMSLWLSNLLALDEADQQRETDHFVSAVEAYSGHVILVSNEVGLGIIGMDALTRRFADQLGWLNQRLARNAHRVVMSVAGLPLTLKGEAPPKGEPLSHDG